MFRKMLFACFVVAAVMAIGLAVGANGASWQNCPTPACPDGTCFVNVALGEMNADVAGAPDGRGIYPVADNCRDNCFWQWTTCKRGCANLYPDRDAVARCLNGCNNGYDACVRRCR